MIAVKICKKSSRISQFLGRLEIRPLRLDTQFQVELRDLNRKLSKKKIITRKLKYNKLVFSFRENLRALLLSELLKSNKTDFIEL